MPVYPESIAAALEEIGHSGGLSEGDGHGRAVNFRCGGSIKIDLGVDDAQGAVIDARFRTNGCGYMTAAAELACRWVSGKSLSRLRGLEDLAEKLRSGLLVPPAERSECFDAVVEALKAAFRDHRERRVEDFAGERALICTCFGVSEDTIVRHIESSGTASVEEISASLRAGSGCGSCRMLIQELVDSAGV